MEKEIILRIHSTAGVCRIKLPIHATLLTLREEVEKHTKIPKGRHRLHMQPNGGQVLTGDYLTLESLGLQNGSILYVASDVMGKIDATAIESYEGKRINAADIPTHPIEQPTKSAGKHIPGLKEDAELSDQSATSSSVSDKKVYSNEMNNTSAAGFRKSDLNEPHFKSFDQFMADCGFNLIELPGNRSYTPKLLEKGRMTKIPPPISLKYQPYRHVDHLELMNVEEIKSFVNFWRADLDMSSQRCGWMYGYYREDAHYPLGMRAVCEAIYEPPQYFMDNEIHLLEDPMSKDVDNIASRLGLEKIGYIFTHLPRNELLSASEVIKIGRLQLSHSTDLHYTGYRLSKFVTCTISPDIKSNGEPVANAFMVSDLGMALIRDGLLSKEQPSSSHLQLREPEKSELFPQILESGKETNSFDVDWFLVRVNESAPKKVRSIFSYTHFPRENRVETAISSSVFKNYFSNPVMARSQSKSFEKFADFHFLLHLYKTFDLDTVYAVCDSILNKTDIELEEVLFNL